MRNRRYVIVGLLAAGGAGCPEPKPTALSYHVFRLSGASGAAVFDAAEKALGEHFTISRSDRAMGILQGTPIESVTRSSAGRMGDVVQVPRRERRVAEIRVESAGAMVKVFCKVLVQECDTQAHEMFSRERTIDDLPTDTPADREGATTSEQNAVWRTKRHDKGLERQIREAIVEQVPGARVM